MGMFEDAVLNMKAAIDTVGEKTGKLVDLSKLKINECEVNNTISKELEKLGKLVYDFKELGVNNEDKIKDSLLSLSSLYDQLKSVNEQINEFKKKKICPNCKAANDIDMKFCGNCGCKIDCECNCEPCSSEPCSSESEDPEFKDLLNDQTQDN